MSEILEARLNVTLHKNQQTIHESGARFKVVKAGKRFGKSKWAIFEVCQMAGKKSGGVFWYIAPTFGQAADIAWNDLLNILPSRFIKRKLESKLTVELISGSKIVLKGADNEMTLRGPSIDGVIFDETSYIDEYIWPSIIRGQLAKSEGPAYFISSPNKSGRNWFTNFHEDAGRRNRNGEDWESWYYTIHDNPTLSVSEIKDIEDGVPENVWKLEYMAIESDTAGQLFSEFSNRHIGEQGRVDGSYYVRGIDWGIAHPTVCLWGNFDNSRPLSEDNRVYVFDEYSRSGDSIMESCETIKRKTGDLDIQWSVIDPSTKKRNSQTLRTDADEFSRWGVPSISGDNRDRGYDIVKMFFKRDLITISPKCKSLIYELRNLQWGDKEGDDCCLIAGTKIIHKEGIVPIEEIKVGDMVLTRSGYKKVEASSITDVNSKIYELKTSNGKSILGTYNHPIFLENGSIKFLSELKNGDKLFDCRCYLLIQSAIWKLKLFLKPAKNLMELIFIEWVGDIFRDVIKMEEKLYCYTEKFGNIIMDEFQMVSVFITRMKINAIMKFPIWIFSPDPNIQFFTQEQKNRELFQEEILSSSLFPPLFFGTKARKVESFTRILLRNYGKLVNSMKRNVISVIEFTKLLFLHGLNFVISTAKWLHFAQDIKVLEVKLLPTRHPVFNLSIQDKNEYFANDILVHNCDTLRYMLVRIHDYTFNMKTFEKSAIPVLPKGVLSFNDPSLFPENKESVGNMDWVIEEVS